jgi:hypothetical protein
VDTVQRKLKLIDIEAVFNLRYAILDLNRRLKEKGVPIFHTRTVEIMLDKALDEMETRCAEAEDKVQELEMQLEGQHQKIKSESRGVK